jgi:hypothetical protein
MKKTWKLWIYYFQIFYYDSLDVIRKLIWKLKGFFGLKRSSIFFYSDYIPHPFRPSPDAYIDFNSYYNFLEYNKLSEVTKKWWMKKENVTFDADQFNIVYHADFENIFKYNKVEIILFGLNNKIIDREIRFDISNI